MAGQAQRPPPMAGQAAVVHAVKFKAQIHEWVVSFYSTLSGLAQWLL